MDHELIEVGDRRWCLCCDLFQRRRLSWHGPTWLPKESDQCPHNTPHARKKDEQIHAG